MSLDYVPVDDEFIKRQMYLRIGAAIDEALADLSPSSVDRPALEVTLRRVRLAAPPGPMGVAGP
jgi:hypothetical protein